MVPSSLSLMVAKALLTPLAKRLPDLLLGTRAERELALAADQAIKLTLGQTPTNESADEVTEVLTDYFSRLNAVVSIEKWVPSQGSLSLLIHDLIRSHIEPLENPELTGVGMSSLDLFRIDSQFLTDALAGNVIDSIIVAGIDPGSELRVLSGVLLDERRHSEILAAMVGLRTRLAIESDSAVEFVGVISVDERNVVVPDGTNIATIRVAVTNVSRDHQRLKSLVVAIAESRPSDSIRLRMPGAALLEYDLSVDLRYVAAVDALRGLNHQFILKPEESDAFRISVTVDEGTKYVLVVHGELESIGHKRISNCESETVSIDFPIQSLRTLRRLEGA